MKNIASLWHLVAWQCWRLRLVLWSGGRWTKEQGNEPGQKLSNTHLDPAYSWLYQLSRISGCPLAPRGHLEGPKTPSRQSQWYGSNVMWRLQMSPTSSRWHQFTCHTVFIPTRTVTLQQPTCPKSQFSVVCLSVVVPLNATWLAMHQTPNLAGDPT